MNEKELREELAAARKSTGLSDYRFANELGVQTWMVDAVENGILDGDGNRISAEQLLPQKDIQWMCDSLKELEDDPLPPQEATDGESDDRFTYYFPVTVSWRALMDEMQEILSSIGARNQWEKLGLLSVNWLMFKWKLYCRNLDQREREAKANAFLKQVQDAFDSLQVPEDE